MTDGALLLFSGGLDSTTALYWAQKKFDDLYVLIVDYQQRHNLEVEMALKITEKERVKSYLVKFPLKGLVYSPLIDKEKNIPESLEKSKNGRGVPLTYVPFRNGIFLAVAAAFAESRQIYNLVTGFNQVDSPDYPDTTKSFTKKMEETINQGTSAVKTGKKFKIHTPLIEMSKKEIIQMGLKLKADYSYSVSCYRGGEIPCFRCSSCEIRSQAFKQLKMEDPLLLRLKMEGKL